MELRVLVTLIHPVFYCLNAFGEVGHTIFFANAHSLEISVVMTRVDRKAMSQPVHGRLYRNITQDSRFNKRQYGFIELRLGTLPNQRRSALC